MTSTAPSERPSARFAGLDGLRAVAVGLVVVYHLFPPALLPGGFIGVDVFFVISGFLITSLLLREHDTTGRVGLGRFWLRRARRLLPALALVVLVCSALAWLIGGDVLVDVDRQALGAATFAYNWVSIAGGSGYFADAAPELFRNFWSLGVEEQFYLLWPLVFPLFLLIPRAWARTAAAFALAVASAGWMATVVSRGDDLTRAYFGTDTHAFGLLLGVGLAFLLAPLSRPATAAASAALPASAPKSAPPSAPKSTPPSGPSSEATSAPPSAPTSAPSPEATSEATSAPSAEATTAPSAEATHPRWVDSTAARHLTGAAGVLALAGLVALATLPPAQTALTFPGALLASSVLSAVAITAGVWPGSWFGRRLDAPPLKWIGDRSYGIYLWHWPLLVLAAAAFTGDTAVDAAPIWIGLGVLAATVAASALSYRFVETPVRRLGFLASAKALASRWRRGPRARLRLVGATLAGALVLAGTGAALATAPDESSAEAAVAAGEAALAEARRNQPPAPIAPNPASTDAVPTPPPGAADVPGDQITAVGDSVMLASAPGLLERLPGIEVDAEVSRSIWAGPGILESLAQTGRLRPYVVVALGTNGPVDPEPLEEMAATVGPSRTLVLVNAYAPRDWIPGVNAELASFADTHHNVVLADWSSAIAPHEDLLAGDRIHPGAAGGRIFADAVATAVDERAAERRARAHDLLELLQDGLTR